MNACSECSKEKYSNTERSSCGKRERECTFFELKKTQPLTFSHFPPFFLWHKESCPAAKFMERGEEETECFPCQAGTFNDQASQVNCKSCPSGYIQATEEKPFCLPCLREYCIIHPPRSYQTQTASYLFILFSFNPQRVLFNLKMARLLVKVAPPDGCNQKMVHWPAMVVMFAQRVNIPAK